MRSRPMNEHVTNNVALRTSEAEVTCRMYCGCLYSISNVTVSKILAKMFYVQKHLRS